MNSMWLVAAALLVLAAGLAWGIMYTRRNTEEERSIKYRAAAIFFIFGFILAAGFIFGAKTYSKNIDITLSWLLLAMGSFFNAALLFFIGFFKNK